MSESTEIMNIAQEMSTDNSAMYCSIQGQDMTAKSAVFNAANNPDEKVADYINKVINVRDILAEEIALVDDESGEYERAVRVVLIDTEGRSYQAVSTGIYNALKKAIAIFGAPTWEQGLPCLIKQVSTKAGSMLTFDIQL